MCRFTIPAEDSMTLQRLGLSLCLVGTLLAGPAMAVEVVKKEPPLGKMTLGQKVLVDDGSCPAGQIKEVTGGDHVKVGGTQHIVRTSRCIPR
jgi:hypothetical protein